MITAATFHYLGISGSFIGIPIQSASAYRMGGDRGAVTYEARVLFSPGVGLTPRWISFHVEDHEPLCG